ncbi:MAG: hypothetical protein AAF664_04660, partial [Planctomycetota bacterium]
MCQQSLYRVIAALASLAFLMSNWSQASDWLTMPGRYSHDPSTGERVAQFAPKTPAIAPAQPVIRSSGFTHHRSSLNYGQSADNYFRVDRWGEPVRPFGEWRFPFRPYSTPYPAWGPPYGGLQLGFGGFPVPGRFGGGFRRPFPGNPNDPANPASTAAAAAVNPNVSPGANLPWPYPSPQQGFGPGGFRWPSDRDSFNGPSVLPVNPLSPYPAGPGTPYPVAPYYD